MAPPPICDSEVSMAVWLPQEFFHYNLLPHFPSIHLSTVTIALTSGIAPQSLQPSSQLLLLKGIRPVQGMSGYGKDCLILISFRLLQISYSTSSALNVLLTRDNCRDVAGTPVPVRRPAGCRSGPTNTSFPLLVPFPSH